MRNKIRLKFPKRKNAQEEMVGFALIIVLVAVILLIFLGFSLNNPKKDAVESFETASFVSSLLQYNTNCASNLESHLIVQDLLFDCENEEYCLDGTKSCDVLNETITEILEESWPVGEDWPLKGYKMSIKLGEKEKNLMTFVNGSTIGNYKGTPQNFPRDIEIIFEVYF